MLKKLCLMLLTGILSFFAMSLEVQAACTTPPLIDGVVGDYAAAPPATDWIPSFYRYSSTQPYAMKVWTLNTHGKITFGSGSGIIVNAGSQCIDAPCSAFTGDKITTLYLPASTMADGTRIISVIANGVKVMEWVNVWYAQTLGLAVRTEAWADGITSMETFYAPPLDGHASSRMLFRGWNFDSATNTWVHKASGVSLKNDCGFAE